MAATLADLDAAIANDATLEADLEAAIAANTAVLQSWQGVLSPDLQPELDKMVARQQAMSAAIQALKDADAANASSPPGS